MAPDVRPPAEQTIDLRNAPEVDDRMRRQFAALAAHELRTPLTSILGYTQMVLTWWDVLEDEQKRDQIAVVEAQARRLARLVDRLLLLTQLDAGTLDAVRERVEVRRVLGEVLGEMGESRSVVSVGVREATGVCVDVKPDHLKEMLLALVDNAVKHGEPPVEVLLDERDGSVEVTVRDAGPGVPDDFRPHLFEPYELCAGGDVADPPSGMGLSLAVARRLARLYRGDLRHVREETGATFVLTLPAA